MAYVHTHLNCGRRAFTCIIFGHLYLVFVVSSFGVGCLKFRVPYHSQLGEQRASLLASTPVCEQSSWRATTVYIGQQLCLRATVLGIEQFSWRATALASNCVSEQWC